MKCLLSQPEMSLAHAHLMLWKSNPAAWPEALRPVLSEMAQADEVQTCRFGLRNACQTLSLLPDGNLSQPAALRKLTDNIAALLPSPVAQPVALDISAFDLADETTFIRLRALLLAIMNRFYQLPQLGYRRDEKQILGELWLLGNPSAEARRLVSQAQAIADGMLLSRRLADLPASDCTPETVAQRAVAWATEHPQTSCEVLDENEIERQQMGCLLATGKGSRNPPRLVTLRWQGAGDNAPTYVFVGKGITFDTGGLWLKGGEGMSTMKYDMCGAAVVFGLLETVKALNLPLNVVAVMALAENMPTDSAMRPGDVVRSHAGHSVEIINTDAEGRLVLADALSYAAQTFKPAALVDVATLTGAVVKALGYDISGMMSNSSALEDRIRQAAALTQDRVWPLPLDESFDKQVTSSIADLTNTPPNNAAIAVSAAQFLSKFCHQTPWAHLDVSGTALSRGKFTQASGRPVHLLTQYLLTLCEGSQR
jgi:leucyl aminopeptidase